jgi:PiT family inorganic phosphate transporter
METPVMYLLADLAASPSTVTWIFLGLALLCALGFEFVNGFHDTANAVATVIYTHSLRPTIAVIWSGLWNLIGVLTSTGGVAFTIVALLPVELVLNVGSAAGFAMVFSLLISAILWNVGTWYLGLPASSTHTLTGSIIGVGIANSLMAGHAFGEGINWVEVKKVGLTLLVSPVVGFIGAALMVFLLKALIRNPALFAEPDKEKAPPLWIRATLVTTCTAVSFAHGSNDGQKGMGLILLILVGVLPGMYAVNMSESPEQIHTLVLQAEAVRSVVAAKAGATTIAAEKAILELDKFAKPDAPLRPETFAALAERTQAIESELSGIKHFSDLPEAKHRSLRTDMYLVSTAIGRLTKDPKGKTFTEPEVTTLKEFKGVNGEKGLDGVTNYIPTWVKVAVAIALGLGTTVGWKRIVVTVGEKIGKSHLTYGQGASAELMAASTILLADRLKLPVSTTHVLSSGIAGTMAANRSGLQMDTLRNILLAWVLTLPACVFLGSFLFAFGNYVVLNLLGLK